MLMPPQQQPQVPPANLIQPSPSPYGQTNPMDSGASANPLLMGDSHGNNPLVPYQSKVGVGTDNWGSINGAQQNDNSEYEQLPAIDRDNIEGLTDEKLKGLELELFGLIQEGIRERYNGGRDGQIEEWRDLYESTPPTKRGPWRGSSSVTPPDLPTTLDTTSSRRIEAIVGSKERVSIDSELPEDQDAIEWCKNFIRKELFNGLGLDKWLNRIDKTSSVDGATIIETYWKRETKKIRSRVMIDDNYLISKGLPPMSTHLNPMDSNPTVKIGKKDYPFNTRQVVEEPTVYNNHFAFKMHNVKDCSMWPASSLSIDEAVVFCVMGAETADYMNQCVLDGYYDKDAVEEALKVPAQIANESMQEIISEETQRQRSSEMVSNTYEAQNRKYGRRQVANLYAKIYDADGDGVYEDIHFVQDWASKKILRAQICPYDNGKRPFRDYQPDPRVGTRFYGYSMSQRLKSMQLEINAVARQGIDRGSLAATVFVPIEPSMNPVNSKEINIGGLNLWDIMRDGKISGLLTMPDMPASNLANRSELSKMIQLAGMADESVQGVTTKGDTTLGQTNIAVAAGNIRLNRTLLEILDTLTWLYNQFFDYIVQYVEEEDDYQYIRDGKKPYNPVVLLDNLGVITNNVVLATCDQVNAQVQVKAMLSEKAFTIKANSPAVNGSVVMTMRNVKTFLEEIGYQGNLDYELGTEKDWELIQQQMDMEKQIQNQLALQGGGGKPGQPPSPMSKPSKPSGGNRPPQKQAPQS